jgi:ElaB/YqjD/DUF883 family membrane-anchored ribosome-binding protein
MNDDKFEGALKSGAGKVESKAGEIFGAPDTQTKGEALHLEGKIQEAIGAAEESLGKLADQATAALTRLADQARDVYEDLGLRARRVNDTVEPFVGEKPYTALAMAAAAGVVIGLLMAGGRPKTIYVKTRP